MLENVDWRLVIEVSGTVVVFWRWSRAQIKNRRMRREMEDARIAAEAVKAELLKQANERQEKLAAQQSSMLTKMHERFMPPDKPCLRTMEEQTQKALGEYQQQTNVRLDNIDRRLELGDKQFGKIQRGITRLCAEKVKEERPTMQPGK